MWRDQVERTLQTEEERALHWRSLIPVVRRHTQGERIQTVVIYERHVAGQIGLLRVEARIDSVFRQLIGIEHITDRRRDSGIPAFMPRFPCARCHRATPCGRLSYARRTARKVEGSARWQFQRFARTSRSAMMPTPTRPMPTNCTAVRCSPRNSTPISTTVTSSRLTMIE